MAAVNISAHANRTSIDEVMQELLPALRTTAERIETDLRAVGRR